MSTDACFLLPCAHCGRTGRAWFDVPLELEDTGFPLRPPAPGQPVRILHWWTCEACGLQSFATVSLADERLTTATPTGLEPGVVEVVHYLHGDLREVVEQLIEGPVWEAGPRLVADWRPRLERALAAGRRWS